MMKIRNICLFLSVLFFAVCAPAGAGEIHEAVKAGDIEKVRAMVDKDPALLYSKDEQGKTPLHWAAGRDQLAIMRMLLDTYHVDVNVRNNNNGTPLHVAASQAHPEAAKILIQHNATIDARANNNATPLHYAAFKSKPGHLEAGKILIQNGADVNARMDNGATPLSIALHRGNTEMAQLLRSNGATKQGKSDPSSGSRRPSASVPMGLDSD